MDQMLYLCSFSYDFQKLLMLVNGSEIPEDSEYSILCASFQIFNIKNMKCRGVLPAALCHI